VYCSELVKPLQMLVVDKIYLIVRVHRLPSHDGTKHFIVRLWEAPGRQGPYIFPIHDIFPQNEIVQLISELSIYGVDISGS